MIDEKGSWRLLLVAGEPLRSAWRGLLPAEWVVTVTGSVEHARLIQRVGACDVVLLSPDQQEGGGLETSDRLFVRAGSLVVLVADGPDERVLSAIRDGAVWVPAAVAREHPALLLAILEQAMKRSRQIDPTSAACRCRGRVDRLLDLLWQATPGNGSGPWFSQRHMLERLDEEVSRTRRDGSPLSVVLGEVRPREGDAADAGRVAGMHEWAASQIGKGKRRCDVAGQYGLDGFMIVLPRATPEQAKGACRRLRILLSHPPEGLSPPLVTFGHAGIPGDRPNISGLLSRAERRLEDSRLVMLA